MLTLLDTGLLRLSSTDSNAEIVEKRSLTIASPSSFASQSTYGQSYDAAPSFDVNFTFQGANCALSTATGFSGFPPLKHRQA